MSSSGGGRSVRFNTTADGGGKKRPRSDPSSVPSSRKEKRMRQNEDELDDVDDYDAESDDNDATVPSERTLLEAKRQRRQGQVKSAVGDGSTHIDNTTSLAVDGVAIEPFHMRQEEQDGTGYFVGDTYIFRKNPDGDEEPDAWLDNLTDENGKQSAEIAEVTKSKRKDGTDDEDDVNRVTMDELTKEELYAKMLPLMRNNETVAQSVRRYGQLAKQKRGKQKGNGSPSKTEATQENRDVAKSRLDDLTGIANALLLKGEVGIYDTTRHAILTFVPKGSDQKSGDPVNKLAPALWEYKGDEDGEVHGPYTTKQMIDWTGFGYFVGDRKVEIRTVREESTSTKDELLADLSDDGEEEDEEKNDSNTKKFIKGDWVWSSEVDFNAYLP